MVRDDAAVVAAERFHQVAVVKRPGGIAVQHQHGRSIARPLVQVVLTQPVDLDVVGLEREAGETDEAVVGGLGAEAGPDAAHLGVLERRQVGLDDLVETFANRGELLFRDAEALELVRGRPVGVDPAAHGDGAQATPDRGRRGLADAALLHEP